MNSGHTDGLVRNRALSKRGRCAVVTNAAEGMGRAIAVRLAEDGADIAIIDPRDAAGTEACISALGRKVLSYRCDMSNGPAVEAAAQAILSAFSRCDILINNPEGAEACAFQEVGYQALRQVLARNLEVPFILCKTLIPAMCLAGWGRVVTIGASSATVPGPNRIADSTARAGLVGLTRGLATEFGPAGITANAIAYGPMAPGEGYPNLGPLIAPSDLIGAVSFLASDDAGFVTAQILQLDAILAKA